MLLYILGILYLPVCLYTWRRLLRRMAENEKRYMDGAVGGIHNLGDFIFALLIATVLCIIVPPFIVGARLLSFIGDQIDGIDGIGVEKLVRSLAGETESIKESRKARERVELAASITRLEQETGIGPYRDEIIDLESNDWSKQRSLD